MPDRLVWAGAEPTLQLFDLMLIPHHCLCFNGHFLVSLLPLIFFLHLIRKRTFRDDTHTHTHTHTHTRLCGNCPGQPRWAGTRRNIHPLTPIVVINRPLYACMIICLEQVQICISPSWCHCHSPSLAPVNPDWFFQNGSASLLLCCRLTQVVLEKRPLNECSSSSSSSSSSCSSSSSSSSM